MTKHKKFRNFSSRRSHLSNRKASRGMLAESESASKFLQNVGEQTQQKRMLMPTKSTLFSFPKVPTGPQEE
jgi:hypothetical protein